MSELKEIIARFRCGGPCMDIADRTCRSITARAGCDCGIAADEIERLEQANTELRRDLAREANARGVLLAEIEAGKKRVAELERDLARANDAAAKGDEARAILGGMALAADPPRSWAHVQ